MGNFMTKIFSANLNKNYLTTIPSAERSLFFTFAHILNEINAFHKLLFWSSADSFIGNEAENDGRRTFAFMFLGLLAGKLKEAGKFLWEEFDKSEFSKTYEANLRSEEKEALARIRHYFENKNNTIWRIRDSLAFHYTPEAPKALDAAFLDVPDNLKAYIEQGGRANNLYYFAEILASRALLKTKGDLGDQTIYRKLVDEILEVARWFVTAFDAITAEFIRRYQDNIWDGDAESVEFDNLQPTKSIKIPWFTDTSDIYE